VTVIHQGAIPEHESAIRGLFSDYLHWVCSRILEEYKQEFDAETLTVQDMERISVFMPPTGMVLIAFVDDAPAGCACTRTIGKGIAELKRMYVRPLFRKQGIGNALLARTIQDIRNLGFGTLKLDSGGFMSDAHALYRSFGFKDIPPYDGSEIAAEVPVEWLQEHWVFMELQL
jgi:GNAT superfamily N-acetyltransferase